MNLRILLSVFIVLEGVFGRTPEDVIKDFEPAFQKIHNEFYQYGNNTKQEVDPMFDNVTLAIFQEHADLNSTLANVRTLIQQKVWDILEEMGMTSHISLIPHCLTTLNKSENTLIATALGGQRICVKFTLDQVAIHTAYVDDLMTALSNEHYIVEATREECGKITEPFFVQECLINDLYVYYPSYFKDVSKEVQRRVELVGGNLKSTIDELDKCDGFIRDGVIEDYNNIFVEFRECVVQAKPFF